VNPPQTKPRNSSAAAHPPVAVVILNWNGRRDTLACLDSLSRLDYPNREIIVVDNGSTDDSVARIRAAHPGVTLLETGANLGFSGGCNAGIRDALARGFRYVWLLNNDTQADPAALSALVETAERDADTGAVASVVYCLDRPGTVEIWGGGRVNLRTGKLRILRAPAEPNCLFACSLLLRDDALHRAGLLDERFFLYWEDTDLTLRIRRAGYRLAVAPDSRVHHRGSASTGRNSPTQALHYHRSAALFYRLHAPFPTLTTAGMIAIRTLRWIIKGKPENIPPTWRGAWSGMRATIPADALPKPLNRHEDH